MKKALYIIIGIFSGIILSTNKVQAGNFTVTKTDAVLYTSEKAGIYALTDATMSPIVTLESNLPIKVTGVTSNGWYEIEYDGVKYMQANGLKAPTILDGELFTYSDEEIKKLTQGTYAFYTSKELSKFYASDVMDMSESAYIRYLDSYIRGYGVLDNCIIQDMNLKLSEYVTGKVTANSSYAAKTKKEMLIDYRNDYLAKSLEGPHRTSKSILQALTRAIRYNKKTFIAEFKNASISEDEKKMKELLDESLDIIKKEQGITFTYTMEYKDDFWYINFEREIKNNQK